ncbi:hypothetical protein Plhal304r1_c010g0039771 [Plasmopara halstedii]
MTMFNMVIFALNTPPLKKISKVTLFCAIDGVKGSAFSVDIDACQLVDHLKKVIKKKREYNFAAVLYLAKKGESWLTENEVKDKDERPTPFICVEGLSGMGKSQLAFALGGRRPYFYWLATFLGSTPRASTRIIF